MQHHCPSSGSDDLRCARAFSALDLFRGEEVLLIRRIRDALPTADCMLWSPMDAGEREGERIVSKSMITEVRRLQKEVATRSGCAFWDMFAAMGGENAFGRWHAEGIMNDDLVHPRRAAGELLGHLFAESVDRCCSRQTGDPGLFFGILLSRTTAPWETSSPGLSRLRVSVSYRSGGMPLF